MSRFKLVAGRIQVGVRTSLMALLAVGGCAPYDGSQLDDQFPDEQTEAEGADDDAGVLDKAAGTLPSCTSRGSAATNTRLNVGECLKSADGRFAAIVQSDGNFVVYSTGGALWATGTRGTGAYLAVQNDGNLVLYASGSSQWNTKTAGNGTSTLTMQNDGALVLRKDSGGTQTWTSGTGTVPPPAGGISHVGTTKLYDSNGRDMKVTRPVGSQAGDLLVLFIHRTDDLTPLKLSGWTRVSECMKHDNGYQCKYASDCTSWHDASYCEKFGDLRGWDLGQAVFVRTVTSTEAASYTFNLAHIDRTTKTFQPNASGEPAWAILSAVRGASNDAPVRAWTGTGCDHDGHSLFPSIAANAGDLLLLSQSNDEPVPESRFAPPVGTTSYGYVTGNDETAFLFGQKLTTTGQTGIKRTEGPGETVQGAWCKDLMLSIAVKPR